MERWTVFDLESEEWNQSLCSHGCVHVKEMTSEEFPGAILRRCALGFKVFPRTRCAYYEGPLRKGEWKPGYQIKPIILKIKEEAIWKGLVELTKKDERTLSWEVYEAVRQYLERRLGKSFPRLNKRGRPHRSIDED